MSSIFVPPPSSSIWRSGLAPWSLRLVGAAAVLAFFAPALEFMVSTWQQVEEYSYCWFIPAIAAFLVWQRSDELRRHELKGSWWGLALIAVALLLGVIGQLGAVRVFSQYGFVLAVAGLVLASLGWRGLRILAAPVAILLFMIPLPQFLTRELSHGLQLVSSQLGVAMIRAAGISVFLEGNVIDLGSYKLQVVEACSGLRYLFPLMVLGVLAAYFYRGPLWHRIAIVASTVPLTIVINSLRIAGIGVTVEHGGASMAEGLLHDLEGGFMFLLCLAALGVEMALLARLSGRGWRDAFAIETPAPAPKGLAVATRAVTAPATAAALLVSIAAAAAWALPPRGQTSPERQPFSAFELQLPGGWQGRTDRLASDVIATLALTDYALINYQRGREPWVNFYSAYYAQQSGGESAHSPRTCIPGDGWSIDDLSRIELPRSGPGSAASSGSPLAANRALISKGEHRQLVYYWFRQRGRSMTGEFEVKWSILRDSVQDGRSDGALIRLITPVAPGEDIAQAEARLADFARGIEPRLSVFIPD